MRDGPGRSAAGRMDGQAEEAVALLHLQLRAGRDVGDGGRGDDEGAVLVVAHGIRDRHDSDEDPADGFDPLVLLMEAGRLLVDRLGELALRDVVDVDVALPVGAEWRIELA